MLNISYHEGILETFVFFTFGGKGQMVLAVHFGVSADCKTELLWAGVFCVFGGTKKGAGPRYGYDAPLGNLWVRTTHENSR
jgi:hypothetical protein